MISWHSSKSQKIKSLQSTHRSSRSRGWLSPSGKWVHVKWDHTDIAAHILKDQYPDWDWKTALNEAYLLKHKQEATDNRDESLALTLKGWVRVYDPNTYNVWSPQSRGNLDDLLIARNPNLPFRVIYSTDGDFQTEFDSVQQYFEVNA